MKKYSNNYSNKRSIIIIAIPKTNATNCISEIEGFVSLCNSGIKSELAM
jgi:hypothetical protein